MRAIFLNRFYWPDEPATAQLLTDLAESLAARGVAVTVITSHPGRAEVPATETRRGVTILRVGGTRWARGGLKRKAADYATYLLAAIVRLARVARRGDIAVAMTDPPLLGLGVWLVAALRGLRFVHWVQDIYPELAIELAGQRWLRVLCPPRNHAWRCADACVTLGSDMARTLAAAGVHEHRIHIVPNWAPAGLAPQPSARTGGLRPAWGLEHAFVVAYSGNLGRVHDLDPVLAVAELLRGEPGIVFLFIGTGARRPALEAEVARRALPNVRFVPPQPRAHLAESLGSGDVHLVTLHPGCERLVFPSKLYGIAAVGRPVIVIGPRECELARLVATAGFGEAFTRDEPAALAAALRRLAADPAACARLGAAATRFAAQAGIAVAAGQWQTLLGALAASALR